MEKNTINSALILVIAKISGVDGALYGEFKVHPQTKVIGQYDLRSFYSN
jgi:hypothetical protein